MFIKMCFIFLAQIECENVFGQLDFGIPESYIKENVSNFLN